MFFQFRDGKSVLNSQCKPRMFKTAEKATLGLNYIDTDDVVEYAEVKHGRWIKVGESCGADILECSVCHTIHPQYGDAFCRDCGCKMDLEVSNEND